MATVTRTASLAVAGVQPKALHAGVNVVSGTWNDPGTLSASGSGLVLFCKVPVGAKIVDLVEYHSTGATSQVLNIGLRHGASASFAASAILGAAAQATVNAGAATLPIDVTGEDTANERFKYVTISRQSGTATTSLKVRMSIMFTLDSDQT